MLLASEENTAETRPRQSEMRQDLQQDLNGWKHRPITLTLVPADSMLACSPQSQTVGRCKDMISSTIVLPASVTSCGFYFEGIIASIP